MYIDIPNLQIVKLPCSFQCVQYKSIEIAENSFRGYNGEFYMFNLPQLQSIKIGIIGSRASSFPHFSFHIRSNDMILYIWLIRSSKSAIHYTWWLGILWFLFYIAGKYYVNLNRIIGIDLPSLQSIKLGYRALCGHDSVRSSSLFMVGMDEIFEILERRSSKSYIHHFWRRKLFVFFNGDLK